MNVVVLDRAYRLLDEPVHYPVGSSTGDGGSPHDLLTHLDRYGPVTADGSLLDAVARAGLTGHGGGHFPVSRKWEAQLARGAGGVLVGNGAESEPLSAKDVALLQLRPHLVLDGLALTAAALGAAETVLWLHRQADTTRRRLEAALAERVGLHEPRPRLVAEGSGYLAGESSAIVRALSGGPQLPAFHRSRAALSDSAGRPVLVHNVETLARIALLARGAQPRTQLLTVACRGRRVVLEVGRSTSLLDAIRLGGVRETVAAALVGGYGGRWLPGSSLATTSCGRDPGAGVVLPLVDGECGLRCAAAIVEFLADAGARQCGPCRNGLPALAEAFGQLADADVRRDGIVVLRRYLTELRGRGACAHPDAATAMIASALEVFATDVEFHLLVRRCADAG